MQAIAKSVRVAGIVVVAFAGPAIAGEPVARADLMRSIARHASEHQVPEQLARLIIKRESGFNPRLHHRAYWGLMQISGTAARSMGYRGRLEGLLDPETNLTYGMPYLANAYIVAHGDQRRAIVLYTRGYYFEAKRKGLLGALRTAASAKESVEPTPPEPEPPAPQPSPVEVIRNLFAK